METGDRGKDTQLAGTPVEATVVYLDKFRKKCRNKLTLVSPIEESLDTRIAKLAASVLRINQLMVELRDINAMPEDDK